MRTVLRGIGVLGGFGCGVADMARALENGESRREKIAVAAAGGPIDLPAFRADTSRLAEFVPARTLRRIDHFSRLALLGAFLAVADAGLPDADRRRLGVIIASGYGATALTFAFLDSFIKDGDACASPTHFAGSVHNSAAANISILLGATGPSLTVSQFDLSVPSALSTARLWLLEGRVDQVLFGAVDEISEFVGYLWYRRRGIPSSARMTPLRTGEETAIPGEGAAFLLLSRREDDRDGYCALDDAATGSLPAGGFPPPRSELLVLGADGRKESGRRYAALAAARVACYTPLYGSMPAGPAFDLAAAALVLRNGCVFASPGGDACDFAATVPAGGERLDAERVSCLTLPGDDGYGLISLSRL